MQEILAFIFGAAAALAGVYLGARLRSAQPHELPTLMPQTFDGMALDEGVYPGEALDE